MKAPFLKGVSTALITPFYKGEIDYSSLKKLIKFQMDSGIQGFIIAGSTGEAATLTLKEKDKLLKFVLSEVAGQIPVVIGIGTNNTVETVSLAKRYTKTKVDGFLVVAPYYNKPPQRGLIAHFRAVAKATKKPILLYNVPSRTVTSISVSPTLTELYPIKNIVGIKEASGNLEVIKDIRKSAPTRYSILSGDDETFIEAMTCGANGVISVISHVIPKICLGATSSQKSIIIDVSKALFCETNPIPVKWALFKMGIIRKPEVRLPLVELDPMYYNFVSDTLKKVGVL